MAARFIGASLGLFAFSVSVAAGLYVRNPVTTVLSRSILALFVFFLIGRVLGGVVHRVVNEHVKAREEEIQQQYARASGPLDVAALRGGSAKE